VLLAGAHTRLAALALAACLVPITVTIQLAPGQMGPLFKNVALLGGLAHFAFAGATSHAWSVDRWLAGRARPSVAVTS
jgi:putative oxidoreductase